MVDSDDSSSSLRHREDLAGDSDGFEKEISPAHSAMGTKSMTQEAYPARSESIRGDGVDTEKAPDDFGTTLHEVESKVLVVFIEGDEDNPYNWSKKRKYYVVMTGILTVVNSTLGSSLPGGATKYFSEYFHVTNEQQQVLPISMYLVGYVLGPLVLAPLSERYGRRPILLYTFVIFTLFTMACALAPNWPAFVVFRLITGMAAASPISISGGLYADIYNDPRTRGRAMACFMAATTLGPVLGPILSGFISVVSWRWTFWVGLIIAGLTLPLVVFLPETYAPAILRRRAQQMRKETGNQLLCAAVELETRGAKQMITVTLTRPLRMMFSEAIVGFTSLYLSVAYAIFYMYFEAYPIIFQGIYGMSTGVSGLAFIPIAIGATITLGIFLYYDGVLERAKARNAPWSQIEEYRRLPLACIGGPLYVVSLFWLGWTASPNIHWIAPLLSGVLFGVAFMLIFMALLNYLTDAYETYAASAMGAASCARSIFGAVIPLAATRMFRALGVHWACSLLAFLSLGMSVIPFVFIRYGARIRAHSQFCQHLLERKRQAQEGEARAREKARRRAMANEAQEV